MKEIMEDKDKLLKESLWLLDNIRVNRSYCRRDSRNLQSKTCKKLEILSHLEEISEDQEYELISKLIDKKVSLGYLDRLRDLKIFVGRVHYNFNENIDNYPKCFSSYVEKLIESCKWRIAQHQKSLESEDMEERIKITPEETKKFIIMEEHIQNNLEKILSISKEFED